MFNYEELEEYPEIQIEGETYSIVCNSDDIYEGKGIKIQFKDDIDLQVAILRVNGNLHALDNICPHRHAERIFEGIIKKNNMTVTCPLHGWTYNINDGSNVNQRQGIKGLNKHKVMEKDGKVYLKKPELNIPKWRQTSEIEG